MKAKDTNVYSKLDRKAVWELIKNWKPNLYSNLTDESRVIEAHKSGGKFCDNKD